jgi:Ca-activated chloride channel family protein
MGSRRSALAALAVCATVVVGTVVPNAAAQDTDEPPPALLLIMDSSGSMNGTAGGGQSKIQAAKDALDRVVDSLPEGSRVGLRVYGHRVSNDPADKPRGCRDTQLISPVGPLRPTQMKNRIASFDARGWTPIGESLRRGAGDLRREDGDKTIVLVSDGIDTCAPPPPCEVAKRIVNQGIDLRIDTVGFQVDAQARRELRCIARVGKGTYVDAGSADDLADNLAQVSLRALRRYETTGTAIQGGTSDADAPPLAPGQYVDSIVPGEERWYSVDLGPGQVLDATVTVVGQFPRERFGVGNAGAYVLSPTLDEVDQQTDPQSGGEENVSLLVSSGEIGTGAYNSDAGTYYLNVRFDSDDQAIAATEFPIEVVVEVEGEEITPTPSEEPEDEGGGSAAPPLEEDDGSDPAVAVGGSLLFLVAGAALGMFGARVVKGARS